MKSSLSVQQMELHAYVDGQLSVEECRKVEAYLETHPEARRQVEEYQLLNRQLKRLYDPVADEPVPSNYLKPRSNVGLWRSMRSLAAAGMLLAIGLSLGFYLGSDLEWSDTHQMAEENHVVGETVMAYAVYTPEVRHPVEVGADQEDHLVEWLSKRIGKRIMAPKLDSLGMRLIGGRLLSTEYGPGALFMYEDKSGTRIVLYTCDSDEKTTAFRFAEQKDVSVFYWIDNSLSYALAGEMARENLLPLARSAYNQLVF